MSGIAWHPMNSCNFILDKSVLTVMVDCGQKEKCTTTWSVLEHPEGLVVFDTGVNKAAITDADEAWGKVEDRVGYPLMEPGWDLPSRLAGFGLDPKDVRYVVNTHLHGDHVGGQLDCPNATFICQQAEYDFAHDPDIPSMVREYPHADLAFDTLNYTPIEGDLDLFGDGVVTLLKTPGHTPGHQSALLRLPETGPVLLTGDAIWTHWNLDEMMVPGIVWYVSEYVRSRRRLLQLIDETGARIFHTHDPATFTDLGWVEGGTYR